MPRMLLRAPQHDRTFSLGWLAVEWMQFMVRHGPGQIMGQPWVATDEQADFIVDCYTLSEAPHNRHHLYDSVFLSRPKGADKSGGAARFAFFEAFGPCRWSGRIAEGGEVYEDPWDLGFRYVYGPGEPIAQHVISPFIRCMATEEKQVGNVFQTIYYNLTDDDCPLSKVPGVDVAKMAVILPWGGQIEVSTASSAAKDGGRETFVIFDETHLYKLPELRTMYDTVVRNLDKRKHEVHGSGTWFLEISTMFAPGEESVAEGTYTLAEDLAEGKIKRGDHKVLVDHRWGDCEDLTDEPALRQALAEAYGDATAWCSIDAMVRAAYDPRRKEADFRRYSLNAKTSPSNSWLKIEQIRACIRNDRQLRPRDMVCLGFDGSKGGEFADDTALVASRVSDGHTECIGWWTKPAGAGVDWTVDVAAVDARVRWAFATFEVVGFLADPAYWQEYLAMWTRDFGDRLKVRSTANKPIDWWTNKGRAMVASLERTWQAVALKQISFVDPRDRVGEEQARAAALIRQFTNAKRYDSTVGLQIRKETPHSKKKIDIAMAATLAVEAKDMAIALGVKPRSQTRYPAKRLR